jgi:hypothetical protein
MAMKFSEFESSTDWVGMSRNIHPQIAGELKEHYATRDSMGTTGDA